MHNHRVAMHRSERKDCRKITPGKIGSRIIVVSIPVVDVPRERRELKNPWSGWGSLASNCQWAGSIQIYDFYGDVFVTAIQMMSARMVTQ
jgi:hypothetical protein